MRGVKIVLAITLLAGVGLTSHAPATEMALGGGGGVVVVTRGTGAGGGGCGGFATYCANYGRFRFSGILRLGAHQTYIGNIISNDPKTFYGRHNSSPLTIQLGGHDISGRGFTGQCVLDPNGPHRSADTFVGACTGSINGRPPKAFIMVIRLLVDTCPLISPYECEDFYYSWAHYTGVFAAAP